jgi:endonuclease/exonuclease/phosphatase family metal-dependent hydrolase
MYAKQLLPAVLALVLPAAAGAQQFTVISSNLWHSGTRGFDYTTGYMPLGMQVTLPGIAAFFDRTMGSGYGVIGMQEVDRGTSRVGYLDVAQHLAGAIGTGWVSRFGGLMSFQGGAFGNAVVSNVTIAKTQYWRFTHDPTNHAQFGEQPRGAVAVRLDFGKKPLWFVNVHLDPVNGIAMRQAWQLIGMVKTLDPDFPVIVAGDLNIRNRAPGTGTPEQTYFRLAALFELAGFEDVSLHRATAINAPATTLDGQLDYIFVYDPHDRITVTSCSAEWVFSYPYVFTDHKALVARCRWN